MMELSFGSEFQSMHYHRKGEYTSEGARRANNAGLAYRKKEECKPGSREPCFLIQGQAGQPTLSEGDKQHPCMQA